MAAPAHVIVGRVRTAHGIRGELVVESLTGDPDRVFAVGQRLLAGTTTGEILPADAPPPRELTIRRSVPFKGGRILRFAEIPDRTAAELWRERYFLVPAEAVRPPGDGEIYYHDLIGMRVERINGSELGRVAELFEVPQGLLLEVETPHGVVMLPYEARVIAHADLERRALVVAAPEGLFEEEG